MGISIISFDWKNSYDYKKMTDVKLRKIIRYIFWIGGVIALICILYLRFMESVSRGYGPDEYHHLHYAYLLTQGKLPFRDFFNIYSPVFQITLYPLFKIIGDNFLVLTASRILVFFYFLISLLTVYKLAALLTDKTVAFAAVVIAAALPIGVEKTLEVRPDNLMITLYLVGIYFYIRAIQRGGDKAFIISGMLFALSFLTLAKILFTMLGFLFGLFIIAFLDTALRRKIMSGTRFVILGGVSVFLLFFLALLALGILHEGVRSMFYYSRLVGVNMRFGYDLYPLYWFNPNDSVYGTYKGLPWYVNISMFAFALVGIAALIVRLGVRRRFDGKWLLLMPLVFSFLYLYTVPRPFLQYLLPFLSLVPLWCAFGISDITAIFQKFAPVVRQPFYLVVFIFLAYSMWESWQVKRWWNDHEDRTLIQYVLTHTRRADVFYGQEGRYVFRLDGHFDYSDKYIEFPKEIRKGFPPLIAQLDARHTKYLLMPAGSIVNRTWPYNEYEMSSFADWVQENFKETGYPNVWVRKDTVSNR